MKSVRYQPNIIITGTPGCGKTSHSSNITQTLGESYKHYNISELAKERDCIEKYDEKLDTHVVDEDRLLDLMEEDLREGGSIVDWHCCDIFPERLIDLVIVLRVSNDILINRLNKRGYKDNKIQENLDCEIMEVVLQDAKEGYQPEIVIELESNDVEQMDSNVDRIVGWVENWVKDHPDGVTNEIDESVSQLKKIDQEFEGSEEEEEEEEEEEDDDFEEGSEDDDEEDDYEEDE
ncbi:hypothetical protein HYPBUDRAFT_151652 [Hyphopichia burtonii NRRL Y-1933]|uniref:Adenylate kinase isoenzyme 6 homolog n=1 Tax=Hyphopichia burtonii NRRL Y-1933 TaxID=984485 RepID=A0A1E4RSM3_9ASCO|nr:hypothetical protein HYPBUDRAFT_151652 [Hyphopichia burtonii NRRL Y-1933]ODV70256.1 hypothetical protein HYPBUDRAFT_151652 [Hyphopichia burtonii NRRL Y-1933]